MPETCADLSDVPAGGNQRGRMAVAKVVERWGQRDRGSLVITDRAEASMVDSASKNPTTDVALNEARAATAPEHQRVIGQADTRGAAHAELRRKLGSDLQASP